MCISCSKDRGYSARRENIIGKRFGKLKVISDKTNLYDSEYVTGQHTYLCVCDCGKTVMKTDSYLRKKSGVIPSCGCVKQETLNPRIKNVVGMKYGRLTVLDDIPFSGVRKLKCICDCGNVKYIAKRDVLSGHTKSCGCLQPEKASDSLQKDWSGYVSPYGIEILYPEHKEPGKPWVWACRCFCGNIFYIYSD